MSQLEINKFVFTVRGSTNISKKVQIEELEVITDRKIVEFRKILIKWRVEKQIGKEINNESKQVNFFQPPLIRQ